MNTSFAKLRKDSEIQFVPFSHMNSYPNTPALKEKSIHRLSSAMHCNPNSSELHGPETATIVHPLELKLLESIVVVVTTCISIKRSGHIIGEATLTADCSKNGNRFH